MCEASTNPKPGIALVSPIRKTTTFDDGIAQLMDGSADGLIFKHSPYCGLSDIAHGQVSAFAREHPDVAILQIDVIHQRDVSNRVEAELALRHESPQVILMKGGRCRWSASHRGVNQAAIIGALQAVDESRATPTAAEDRA